MRAKIMYLGLLLLIPISFAQDNTQNKGTGVSKEVLDQYTALDFEGMPYRLLLPENYDASKKYPLILSLHGRAGVGNDNESQMRGWTEVFADPAWRAKYPCVVIAPQSSDSWTIDNEPVPEFTEEYVASLPPAWHKRFKERGYAPPAKGPLSRAFALVDRIEKDYSIDTNRVYVLGHSMGGFGSWNAICSAPERFAAAIPSAGGLPPWRDYGAFKDVPTWAFHGDADPTVPVEYTRQIFARMKELGGNMKYSEIKGAKHNASNFAFTVTGGDLSSATTQCSSERCDQTTNVWDWLFKQRLDKR